MKNEGNKYEATKYFDIAEIAKLIRRDYKQAVKDGVLPAHKVSVRIERYSMGQSIRVAIKELEIDGHFFNPYRTKLEQVRDPSYGSVPVMLNHAENLMEKFESILQAYNYDNSDGQSDYYERRYYGRSELDYDLRKKLRSMADDVTDQQAEDIHWKDEEKRDAAYEERKKEMEKREAEEAAREAEEKRKNAPIPVKKITFHWSESPMIPEEGKVVHSAAEANGVMMVAASARTAEKELGGYYKTKLTIEWENGQSYEGRWDIGSLLGGLEQADCCIGTHIESAARYYLIDERCPEAIRNQLDDEDRKFFQMILDGKYEVY